MIVQRDSRNSKGAKPKRELAAVKEKCCSRNIVISESMGWVTPTRGRMITKPIKTEQAMHPHPKNNDSFPLCSLTCNSYPN
jgi:hypothetical protein